MDIKSQDLHFKAESAAAIRTLLDESFPSDLREKKKRWLYGWTYETETGQIELSEKTTTWDDEILADLLRLQIAGVRGDIVLEDGSGEAMKYSLTNSGLEERQGKIVYPDEADHVWLTLTDLNS